MTAFVILCEAYMGIEHHFNLWNYFLHDQLHQGLGTEVAALSRMDIFIRSGHRVDPYFHLPMSGPPDEWWKVWLFVRNDTDVPLPVFTGSCPIPQPNWGYGVAQRDLYRVQPLCEVVLK
jgi:hypothetical protein